MERISKWVNKQPKLYTVLNVYYFFKKLTTFIGFTSLYFIINEGKSFTFFDM